MQEEAERIASELAPSVARELRAIAGRGGTEADFRREAARVLEEAGSAAGLTIVPRDEYQVARGNVDSLYNRLVLEYKRPGILRNTNASPPNRRAIDQVKGYIEDVATRERREAQRLAGVVTDGFHLIFVRRVGEGWSEDEATPVDRGSTEMLLRLLFSLSRGVALIAENLVEDFGPRHLRSRTAVRALYRGYASSKSPLVGALFEQWRTFFAEATDYKEWSQRIESKPEFRDFVASLWTRDEIRLLDPARVFFILHTYYAFLIKLVATFAAARFAGGPDSPLPALAAKNGDELKDALAKLERGGLFREYGIRNFLEGDFFGWYLPAWNEDIEEAASSVIRRLVEYDPGALELAPENARDLLKKLYHSLLPRQIRHDLGEYYTPDWLAERLIRQTLGESDLGDATKRVLDPACGSGTFLVLLIKFIRERADRHGDNPRRTLELILRNVVGFDLNPLAVIAARTNFLIALGDLLQARVGDIDIPVYQADSIMAPDQGADLRATGQSSFEGDAYSLKTSAGVFKIPSIFAEQGRLDLLSNTLDEAVEESVSEEAFLARVRGATRLQDEEAVAVQEPLTALYLALRRLHDEGVNGVWARIIKNAFAPVLLEPCHYVVGNPPWVGWENLPDDYRLDSKPLWEHYGLFPHGGMDTILGRGKKDISMLMTYVAMDKYLRRGGRLGFVFSQSLFKTSGAGQGFRRFRLPDGTTFGPLAVEDMVELKPFEGAANRTAVAILPKGRTVRYPVSYQRWRKKTHGRGSAIGFDTPYEEVKKDKITSSDWSAEPIDRDDPTSAWITARRPALAALQHVRGQSGYKAHAGSYTGGANAVYWVEIIAPRPGGVVMVSNITEGARRKVPSMQAAVEEELLYPLLRGRDVHRWISEPSAHILMAQDPRTRRGIAVEKMEQDFPRAHAWLKQSEGVLRARRDRGTRGLIDQGAPFWSIFGVAEYTMAPWKVVWREQASPFTVAVVGPMDGRPVVPDHKLMLVEARSSQEAHYLCAMLNSAPATFAVGAYVIEVSTSTHVLENIAIPLFSAKDPIHVELARLSQAAHEAASADDSETVARLESEIDEQAALLWDLNASQVSAIRRSLEEA